MDDPGTYQRGGGGPGPGAPSLRAPCSPVALQLAVRSAGQFSSLGVLTVALPLQVCMDPACDSFRGRCEANPALLGACCVLWWPGWSAETLQQLPAERLQVGAWRLHRPGFPASCCLAPALGAPALLTRLWRRLLKLLVGRPWRKLPGDWVA
jgi:hypothetical protein